MGALLDSHALYWLVSGEETLSNDALVAIGENQAARTLYVSPITAWELTIAAQKRASPPNLGTGTPAKWFRDAVRLTAAKVVPIGHMIAIESAAVATRTGHRDPGDCYLIATARVKKVPIITRDRMMIGLAAPNYLNVIIC